MKELIDAAIAIAQRHRHAEVSPDHVTAAIAENDAWWRKRVVPVVRPELANLVDAELAALAVGGSYRSHLGRPKLSPRTEALFAPSKWLRREITLPLVLRRLEIETPLFKEAMTGVHSVGAEVRAAFHVMESRKHDAGLAIEHVLWVMSEREWFRRAIVMAGGDSDELTAALDRRLAGLSRGTTTNTLSRDLEQLIARARLNDRLGMIDSLLEVALLRDRVKPIFASSGVSLSVLGDLLVTGELRK